LILEAGVCDIQLADFPAPSLWSFDSRFLAFLSADGKLNKVDVSGGPRIDGPGSRQAVTWI
jgi:hypothetical protein